MIRTSSSFQFLEETKKLTASYLLVAVTLMSMPILPAFAEDGNGDDTVPVASVIEVMEAEPVATESSTTTAESTPIGTESDAISTQESTSINTNIESEDKLETAQTVQGLDGVTDENVIQSNTATTTATTTARIETGDATAASNIVNLVNTSFFNSSGWIFFLDNFLSFIGNVDTRIAFDETNALNTDSINDGESQQALSFCTFFGCANNAILSISNSGTADIMNDAIIRATSGENMAADETVHIDTGNAYAAANIVNIANTNIVDSNYVVVAVNNFGDWVGDLILPSAQYLASGAPSVPGSSGGALVVENNSETELDNSVGARANSGDNTAIGTTGGASINTGSSAAVSNILNHVNENLIGGTTVYLVIRVFGNWAGTVYNAPQGISWQNTPGGVVVEGDIPGLTSGGVSGIPYATTTIANNSATRISNNVSVFALTGANEAHGMKTEVNTGNAFAAANIVNVAGTNIFGKNWILAVVNIFGNWLGNVSFGQPDLWIGGRANITPDSEHTGKARPGTAVNYSYTVTNRGDASAHNVILSMTRSQFLASPGRSEAEDTTKWIIGTLLPGETREYSYDTSIRSDMNYGDTLVQTMASVSLDEEDANTANNTEDISFVSYAEPPHLSQGGLVMFEEPKFTLSKTSSASIATASSTTDYRIKINNSGGPGYQSALVDVIKNAKGDIIYRKQWDLGEIKHSEEITVDYTVLWSASTTPGLYTNTAQVLAIGKYPTLGPGVVIYSPIATSTIRILGHGEDTSAIMSEEIVQITGENISGSLISESATSTFDSIFANTIAEQAGINDLRQFLGGGNGDGEDGLGGGRNAPEIFTAGESAQAPTLWSRLRNLNLGALGILSVLSHNSVVWAVLFGMASILLLAFRRREA